MRRADRLFQIIQILRRARRPRTARAIADELETSVRTVYRDIAELLAQRVPIRGEAGIGYVLERGYDMPPLMLTPDEIEAAVLGAQWVAARGDAALSRGARDLIAKINVIVPQHLRPVVLSSSVMAPELTPPVKDAIDMAQVRTWIRKRGKLRIRYADRDERESERIIWPIAVAYFDAIRVLVGWCELRQAFRHFRSDRIRHIDFLNDSYPSHAEVLHAAWQRQEQARGAGRAQALSARHG